jgi:hypothetical protein
MNNVNGHAGLSGLQLCPQSGSEDMTKRQLRRMARQIRQENVEEAKRRRLMPPTPLPVRPALKLVHATVELGSPAGTMQSKSAGAKPPQSKQKRRPEAAIPATAEHNQEPAPAKPPKGKRKAASTAQKPTRSTPGQHGGGTGGKPGKRPRSVATSESGTKKETVLGLLRRPQGATVAELMQATGWQSHSVRGFLSGALKKKMGLKVRSGKRADGVRTYSVRP